MLLIRLILLPLSLIYALVIILRNKFYDWKIFSSTQFSIPVISVGNITVGGTGKTPHIAYLIALLKDQYKIAVLSRGYGRSSTGFKLVSEKYPVTKVGDEALMLKQKYPETIMAVDESRINGINTLLESNPDIQVMLLDDAFQHRAVKPGLSVVLVDYYQPVFNERLLPAGRLRENKSALSRADVIVLSKTPIDLTIEQQHEFEQKIQLQPHQKLYFSYLSYGDLVSLNESISSIPVSKLKKYDCLLVTGIANTKSLIDFVKPNCQSVKHIAFNDHHNYSADDIKNIIKQFEELKSDKKIILTTEKDAVRFNNFKKELLNRPVYYVPIEVQFHTSKKEKFQDMIFQYINSPQS